MCESEIHSQQSHKPGHFNQNTVRVVVKHEPKVDQGENDVSCEGYSKEWMEVLGDMGRKGRRKGGKERRV